MQAEDHPQELRELIRNRAFELGFDACRFTTAAPPPHADHLGRWLAEGRHGEMAYLERNAFKRVDPSAVLPSARSIVCLATSYHHPAAEPNPPSPQQGVVARYARHNDYHELLAEPLKALVQFMEDHTTGRARSLWYVDTGPILERDLAMRAGLGFTGKHTNLIHRNLGNWMLLAEILTPLPLPPDPPERNHCGKCQRCIDVCPTQAITAPFKLDARRCVSYLTIELKGPIPTPLRRAIGNKIFGCDDCLAVCPWNRFAKEGRLMAPHRRQDLDQPQLLELLRLDEATFRARFKGSPILRGKRRGLLRNVCVALGNVAGEDALADLARASSDPEPLVAEHASWAIEEIKSRLGGAQAAEITPGRND